ncbi:Protein-tyrosine-phosphatase [Rhodovastum atsumiense]|nr:protein-tyrosine-phosphatase [Rhodovastum atsumiense]CAH2603349.1 Protein-tyrosine-phosphatase [Rhodovastum atsumiense]
MDGIAPFRITICGLEELDGHCASGVSHVLSILDPDWPVPEAFGSFGEHRKLELRFHDVIEPDIAGTIAPEPAQVAALLGFGQDLISDPQPEAHLLVHCHAGVSRSTAAMALLLAQALPEIAPGRILQEVLRIRPQAWPNLRIIDFGDALLGRDGALIAATRDAYRCQLAGRPSLAEEMTRSGRGREITLAQGEDL